MTVIDQLGRLWRKLRRNFREPDPDEQDDAYVCASCRSTFARKQVECPQCGSSIVVEHMPEETGDEQLGL